MYKLIALSDSHRLIENNKVIKPYSLSNNLLIRSLSLFNLINSFYASFQEQREETLSLNGNDPNGNQLLAIINASILLSQGLLTVFFILKDRDQLQTNESKGYGALNCMIGTAATINAIQLFSLVDHTNNKSLVNTTKITSKVTLAVWELAVFRDIGKNIQKKVTINNCHYFFYSIYQLCVMARVFLNAPPVFLSLSSTFGLLALGLLGLETNKSRCKFKDVVYSSPNVLPR
ncbi:hypothetical protein DID75_02065 [Candidatus Marinamargulisbacteria bacterium SCGC AG-410-N11]|nr:hypothetical protein DID75_02065 [Candidatus Marinamargulisbacteria bacterium SCGC AG-410-N11]